jgi:hypothetical protein
MDRQMNRQKSHHLWCCCLVPSLPAEPSLPVEPVSEPPLLPPVEPSLPPVELPLPVEPSLPLLPPVEPSLPLPLSVALPLALVAASRFPRMSPAGAALEWTLM